MSSALGNSLGLSGAAGLAGTTALGNWLANTGVVDSSMPEQDGISTGISKSRGIEDLPTRRDTDKGVSVEVRLVTRISDVLFLWCVFALQLFTIMVELAYEIRIKGKTKWVEKIH